MVYSDTSLKNGLLQDVEFWIGTGDGSITGDATLKAQITNRLNRRYERAMGMLGAGSRLSQVDDTNYTNQPFSYFNLVSGQNDYQFLVDADGNSITDITAVAILPSTTATEYEILDRLTDEPELIMSPNASNTGTPTGYIERNNTVFFNTIPNYSKTAGGKLFYKRVPSYFVVADTTKAPGFETSHHQMLSLGVAYDWLLAHNSGNTTLITRVEAELTRAEKEFRVYCELRNPVSNRMTTLNQDNH